MAAAPQPDGEQRPMSFSGPSSWRRRRRKGPGTAVGEGSGVGDGLGEPARPRPQGITASVRAPSSPRRRVPPRFRTSSAMFDRRACRKKRSQDGVWRGPLNRPSLEGRSLKHRPSGRGDGAPRPARSPQARRSPVNVMAPSAKMRPSGRLSVPPPRGQRRLDSRRPGSGNRLHHSAEGTAWIIEVVAVHGKRMNR